MSLRELLAAGRLKRRRAIAQGIRKLFAVVERDLADARVTRLSPDRRFTIAYNAALQAGRAPLAAEGYRTSGQGHHAAVFQALRSLLDKEHHALLDYFDDCRAQGTSVRQPSSSTAPDDLPDGRPGASAPRAG